MKNLRSELDILVALGFGNDIIRLVFNDGYILEGTLMEVYLQSEEYHYKRITHADFGDIITLKVHCIF